VAVLLASPFTLWNFLLGQSAFLTAALLGAALFSLERRPALAGVLIGLMTYKPQWGVLLPVALLAGRQWRAVAVAVAAATAAGLALLSAAFFGLDPWFDLPRQMAAQAGLNLFPNAGDWGRGQTAIGLVRWLGFGVAAGWTAQGLASAGAAVVVWFLWHSETAPDALRAAALSAGILLASPYAFAGDLTLLALPVAFLARDQIERGLLRGEQTALIQAAASCRSAFRSCWRCSR
jgi:hypothetical protein